MRQDVVIEQELARNPRKIKIGHIHPLNNFTRYGMSPNHIEVVRKGAATTPSSPPTLSDIHSTIIIQALDEEQFERVSSVVVDPRGVWELSVDLSHEYAKKTVILRALIENLLKEEVPMTDSRWVRKEQMERWFQEKVSYLRNVAEKYIKESIINSEQGLNPLIEAYQSLGCTLTFKTFDELRGEEDQ